MKKLSKGIFEEKPKIISAKGKFDQFNTCVYDGLIEVLRDLFWQAHSHFGESEIISALQQLDERTRSVIVKQLLPDIDEFFQLEEALPTKKHDIPSVESRCRLATAICKLFTCISSLYDYPMIILFDDVQWAADTTMYVIKSLIQTSKAFFILCYRSQIEEHKNYNHVPSFLTEDLEMTPEYFIRIPLYGLSLSDVQKLTSDMMGCKEPLEDLASVIHVKTNGNPLFIVKVSTFTFLFPREKLE